MRPKQGEIYSHDREYGIYARVDNADGDWVLFSVWDTSSPGWQSGAGLYLDEFAVDYSDGPYPESYIPGATVQRMEEVLRDEPSPAFEKDEKYTVSLSSTHWKVLEASACLSGWVKARELGLTPAQRDLIVTAAVAEVRKIVEHWARQEEENHEIDL